MQGSTRVYSVREGLVDTSVVIDWDDPAVAAVTAVGRSHRSRVADLLNAAVAHANKLPLYRRRPQDFAGLGALIAVEAV